VVQQKSPATTHRTKSHLHPLEHGRSTRGNHGLVLAFGLKFPESILAAYIVRLNAPAAVRCDNAPGGIA